MVKSKSSVVDKFKKHEKDTGSVEVQIVRLTADINELQGHCKDNPKDHSSRRGLLKMVNRRKRFLLYVKDRGLDTYKALIMELGLRK
jgi:small subunit ribosomal protein S15